jgi:hypothetical protein
MFKLIAALATVLGFFALIFILSVLFAYPTMWIVNYLFAPGLLLTVFGTSKLTVLKALVFNLFVGLLHRDNSEKSSSSK